MLDLKSTEGKHMTMEDRQEIKECLDKVALSIRENRWSITTTDKKLKSIYTLNLTISFQQPL